MAKKKKKSKKSKSGKGWHGDSDRHRDAYFKGRDEKLRNQKRRTAKGIGYVILGWLLISLTGGYVTNVIFEYAGGFLSEIGKPCAFIVMLIIFIAGVTLMLIGWKGTEYSDF